tara:strand:- start:6064 stop:6540 length:477 start_codon:yes stop_codon:yes gene_type:complete
MLKLDNNWTFYLHLHDNHDWSIDSYIKLMNFDCLNNAILLNDEINYDLIKKSMMFLMKNDILPIWECDDNKDGGCFSFKILNKDVETVWKHIYINVLCKTITKDIIHYDKINGITLSPKKKFCILKIWMEDCELNDPNIFIEIENVNIENCLFKKHCS